MSGLLFPILAGILISLQSVFNTRVSEKIGMWGTVAVVHGIGLLAAVLACILFHEHELGRLGEVSKMYLLGGVMGVGIVFCVMKGVSSLGVSFSVPVLLVTQLAVAVLIDAFGVFGSPRISVDMTKFLGLGIMVAGIVIFKLKG